MWTYLVWLAGQPDPNANPLIGFLPIILIFIVFYFFIIRPQKKKEQQRKEMIEAVRKGDKVITVGGIHATVTQVDDDSLLAQIDTNTKVRLDKSAVATVVGKDT